MRASCREGQSAGPGSCSGREHADPDGAQSVLGVGEGRGGAAAAQGSLPSLVPVLRDRGVSPRLATPHNPSSLTLLGMSWKGSSRFQKHPLGSSQGQGCLGANQYRSFRHFQWESPGREGFPSFRRAIRCIFKDPRLQKENGELIDFIACGTSWGSETGVGWPGLGAACQKDQPGHACPPGSIVHWKAES